MRTPKERPYPLINRKMSLNTEAFAPSGVKLPKHLEHVADELMKAGLVITGLAKIE